MTPDSGSDPANCRRHLERMVLRLFKHRTSTRLRLSSIRNAPPNQRGHANYPPPVNHITSSNASRTLHIQPRIPPRRVRHLNDWMPTSKLRLGVQGYLADRNPSPKGLIFRDSVKYHHGSESDSLTSLTWPQSEGALGRPCRVQCWMLGVSNLIARSSCRISMG